MADDNEIYAVVLKGTVDIQGMVALSGSSDFKAVHIAWMCAAPQNNLEIVGEKKYLGVGGHLFAIAAQRSKEMGYESAISGYASDLKLAKHYCDVFGAELLGILHPYQIFIDTEEAEKIMEVYDYEWNSGEL